MQRCVSAWSARFLLPISSPKTAHLLQTFPDCVVVIDFISKSAACKVSDVYFADELAQVALWKSVNIILLDGIVRVHDDGDEQRKHDVDVKADKGVEVNAAEPPKHQRLVAHYRERREHVVAVYERKKALGSR